MYKSDLFKKKSQFKKDSLFSGNLLIVIRGHTFRKCKLKLFDKFKFIDIFLSYTQLFTEYIQIYCIKTLIKHVIKPIKKTYPNLQISVQFLVYPNINNLKLVKLISKYCECKITNLSKIEDNQLTTFMKCLNEGIKNNVDGLLIIRPDLAWIQDFDPRNFCNSKILFQWNLLHDNTSLEIADQIHFLGKKTLKPIYQEALQNPIDEKWPGTLHNLLNFAIKIISQDNVGYLNYIADPNPNRKNSTVEIRGNSQKMMGNPLYLYSTEIRKILFRSNITNYLVFITLKLLNIEIGYV